MARSEILLLFRLAISASIFEEETLIKYIKEITLRNDQRSVILVYKNLNIFSDFSRYFYNLEVPSYNIYLDELKSFNGEYHDKYDIAMTYEESKLYFIFLSELRDIYNDLFLIRKIYFWRDRDRIVVFTQGNFSFPELRATFLFCYEFYIVNIVFTFINTEIRTFSYNPFTEEYFLVDVDNLFPDKFHNLYGYQLKISMFPSVINPFNNGEFYGRDGLMAATIAHHINASYVYILPKKSKFAPVLVQYDDVAARNADVGFNTRYVKFNFKNLIEKIYPHDRDDLTCLIPKIRVEKLTLFTSSVWFLSLVTSVFFFVYVIANSIVQKRKLNVINIVTMILILLLNKPIKERRGLDFRIALISFLTLSFLLNTLIVCRLTSIFTAPTQIQGIETLKELAETDYEIVTIDRFQKLLNVSLNPYLKNHIFSRMVLIKEEEYLSEIFKCESVVFICKDHLAEYALIQIENFPNGVQFYRIMKERILPTLSCYIVSYGSPFLHRIDTLVRRIVESGINDYWKMKTWNKLDNHYELRFRQNFHKKPITINDIWLGIEILLYGLCISSFVFLVELSLNFH